MPFTLHRTPSERALEHQTAVDWRDLDEECPWEDASTAAARFVVDHAAVIAGGNSGLGSAIAATIAANIEHAHEIGLVQTPPLTGEKLELIIVRWILCGMYVNNLMDWNQAARRAFRQHRFGDNSESDDEFDLPKTGWEERDRIETLLLRLDKCRDCLPEDWRGERTPLTDLLEESIASHEAAPTTSSRRRPVARQMADTGSTSSEDDFILTIGGEALTGIRESDVFPGGDDEGREREESENEEDEESEEEESETDPDMPGLISPDGSETDTDFSENENDVTEEEMSAFMAALAEAEDTLNLPPAMQNLVETDEESEDNENEDDGWEMPNRERVVGEFIDGQFVEHVE